jgi:hypothetical protein
MFPEGRGENKLVNGYEPVGVVKAGCSLFVKRSDLVDAGRIGPFTMSVQPREDQLGYICIHALLYFISFFCVRIFPFGGQVKEFLPVFSSFSGNVSFPFPLKCSSPTCFIV